MKVVFNKKCLEYQLLGHPESSQRVKLIYEELRKDKRFEFVEPKEVKVEDLLLVHDKSLVESIRNNTFSDPDTPNIENIYYYATLSVGSTIAAAEISLKEKYAFSLARPPGHHATKSRVGGFCYFNNIAIAVAKLLKLGRRVAILDIDVHHGNGTQDIFLGKKNIIFCSIHQIPLYPGTGFESEKNCYNFPLSTGSDFTIYKEKIDLAISKISEFKPDVLAVSLGFDTYKLDPLANIKLEILDYFQIGKMIKSLKLQTFLVLEGGYSNDIGKCAKQFFEGFLI